MGDSNFPVVFLVTIKKIKSIICKHYWNINLICEEQKLTWALKDNVRLPY